MSRVPGGLVRKSTLLVESAGFNDRRQMSLIRDDPLLLEKLRAEACENAVVTQKVAPTPADRTPKPDPIRFTRDFSEAMGPRRRQVHLQSADLFDYFSPVQKERQKMKPTVCDSFTCAYSMLCPLDIPNLKQEDADELRQRFPKTFFAADGVTPAGPVQIEGLPTPPEQWVSEPLTIGIILSGGPAPGGHNVIAGAFDSCMKIDARSRVIGFRGGLDGLFNCDYLEINKEVIGKYRNSGGFDMIWSGRGMVTERLRPEALRAVLKLNLNGLIIIGGDGSNSNAAILAEYFEQQNCKTRVIGVPKTIDGDLKNAAIECSFGFDTAAKTYSELIGNLCTDSASGQGVWHFVRVMGRQASHLVVECAMQTRPNLVYVGEECEAQNTSVREIVDEISDLIIARAKIGKNYGIVLLPEGLISFIPEMKLLISEMSEQLCAASKEIAADNNEDVTFDPSTLSPPSLALWDFLPMQIQHQLLSDREASGYVQVAKIATERLIIQLVEEVLVEKGFDVKNWHRMHHYFGYEGRCAMPSNFDANYCYNLGITATTLIRHNYTGYMAIVKDLDQEPSLWTPAGVPFVVLMRMLDLPMGRQPGIIRQLVDINSVSFDVLSQVRPLWKMGDFYRSPGPIQFQGPVAGISNYTVEVPTLHSLLAGNVDDLKAFSGVGRAETPRRLGCYSELQQMRVLWRPPIPAICTEPLACCVRTTQYVPKDPYVRRQTLFYYPNMCKDNEFHLQEVRLRAAPKVSHRAVQNFRNDSAGAFSSWKRACGFNENSPTRKTPRVGLRMGIVFLSRHSPGQQNILWGVHERVKMLEGTLLGFKCGSGGLIEDKFIVITDADIQPFRNLGGSDLLGRGTLHLLLERKNQAHVLELCKRHQLDGLILVGSAVAMTEAACLAEYFKQKNSTTCIIGVPATASNNVSHELIETNIGFDTASKLYASLIGNVLTDAASMPKYWHFVRLMGRQPSNEVLECALQTHPNCVVIAEEYGASQKTLDDVVQDIANIVCSRAETDREHPKPRNFGAVLIPDGLWHHLPTMKLLLQDLDRTMAAANKAGEEAEAIQELLEMSDFLDENAPVQSGEKKWAARIAPWSAAVWRSLPPYIQKEFLTTNYEFRDSYVETEVLISQLVTAELKRRKAQGCYNGNFQSVCHYFGYQGRSAMPSNFDATLGLVHGYLAAICVESGITGHLTTVRGLCSPIEDWRLGAIPFNCLLALVPQAQKIEALSADKPGASTGTNEEQVVPVIASSETDLNSKALRWLMVARENWSRQDRFCNPGPIQFWGSASSFYHRILHEEQAEYSRMLRHVHKFAEILRDACDFGVEEEFLKFAYASLNSLLTLRFRGDMMLANGPRGFESSDSSSASSSEREEAEEEELASAQGRRAKHHHKGHHYHRLPSKSDWKMPVAGL